MNSYYSNLIEGHKTLPRDIERALRNDFAADAALRDNQRLNHAHIEVDVRMRQRLENEPRLSVHSPEFITWLHGEFYRLLPPDMQFVANQRGVKHKVEPGALRDFDVTVGNHQPPSHAALPQMMTRFADAYENSTILATDQLIALAAAHHRLAWTHPFGDGNGRVARLYSHACLLRAGADSLGLWTLSRGLARRRPAYFAALHAADQKRWNDLDGRGNLSDRALADFCHFFLEIILDQIDFMTGLFDFQNLATRIDHHLRFNLVRLQNRDRERLSRLLRAALVNGEVQRGQVSEIVGLGETSSRHIIRLALDQNLLASDSPKGPLYLLFSSQILDSYFPSLYQDLPA